MATIIINFIVKHHVFRTYQYRVLHENIENYHYVCFPNYSRYKVIKNVSIEYTYQISLETVMSQTVMSSKLNVENSAKW